jgi:hypothetical protein
MGSTEARMIGSGGQEAPPALPGQRLDGPSSRAREAAEAPPPPLPEAYERAFTFSPVSQGQEDPSSEEVISITLEDPEEEDALEDPAAAGEPPPRTRRPLRVLWEDACGRARQAFVLCSVALRTLRRKACRRWPTTDPFLPCGKRRRAGGPAPPRAFLLEEKKRA